MYIIFWPQVNAIAQEAGGARAAKGTSRVRQRQNLGGGLSEYQSTLTAPRKHPEQLAATFASERKAAAQLMQPSASTSGWCGAC